MTGALAIQRYDAGDEGPVVGVKPWDPRALDVARDVGDLLRRAVPGATVEHVGSTAVPNCDGKGIVDLLVVVPPAASLADARAAVETLGFHEQTGGVRHGEERPMREGSVEWGGRRYRLHVHILPEGAPAVESFRVFRDRLLKDPALVAAYVAQKRAVVTAGAQTREAYTAGKAPFIQGALQGK